MQDAFSLVGLGPVFFEKTLVDPFVTRAGQGLGEDAARSCQILGRRHEDVRACLPLRQRLEFLGRQVQGLWIVDRGKRLADLNGRGQRRRRRRRWCRLSNGLRGRRRCR